MLLATLLFGLFHTVVSQRFHGQIRSSVKAIPLTQIFAILDCEANRIHCPCKASLQSDWVVTIIAKCTTKVFYVPLTLPLCEGAGPAWLHTHTHTHTHNTHTHTYTQTDGQTDRQTDTDRHRQTDTHTHTILFCDSFINTRFQQLTNLITPFI